MCSRVFLADDVARAFPLTGFTLRFPAASPVVSRFTCRRTALPGDAHMYVRTPFTFLLVPWNLPFSGLRKRHLTRYRNIGNIYTGRGFHSLGFSQINWLSVNKVSNQQGLNLDLNFLRAVAPLVSLAFLFLALLTFFLTKNDTVNNNVFPRAVYSHVMKE